MSDKYRQVIIRLCCMVLIPIVSVIHVTLNVYRENMHNISTPLDNIIPFVAAFSVPYLYWFVYVFIGLVYFAFTDNKIYFQLLGSIVVGMCLCFVVFYFYPTTVPRPDIIGNSLMERAVGYIYSMDNPYNCFPSIHVLNAMLVTLFFCRYRKNSWLRAWAMLSGISIILSTLFVKQHFVLDAVAGIILSTAVYMVFTSEHLWNSVFVQKLIAMMLPARQEDSPDTLL